MDSFTWFGEIGNQQYDSLKPPGDIHKETFNTARIGLESLGGGGGGDDGPDWEEVADLQHEQAMNSYNYDWDNTQRQYSHMLLQNEIQRRDQAVQHAYQTEQQKQQWMYATAQQERQYNAEVAAFNKSEKLFGHQIDMNQISAEMARDTQKAQTDERFQDLMFQTQTAILEQQTKRGGTALQGQEQQLKGMKALSQAKAAGKLGRSAEKQYQAISAEIGRSMAASAYELNRSDIAYRLMHSQRDATKLSIRGAHTRAIDKIVHDQYEANVKAEMNRLSAPSRPIPIPKPLEIPIATIIDPIYPVKGKPPVWGAFGGGPSSAGSTGGGGPSAGGFVAGAANGFMMGAATGMPHMAGIGALVGVITSLFG